MPLDLASVGQSLEPSVHRYGWKDVVLYALGIGAGADELDYLWEGRGPKVYPTFAVVPTFAANLAALGRLQGNLLSVVHGGQKVTVARPLPPEGTLTTHTKISAVYDLIKMAQAIVQTRTTDERGELLFETEWSIIFRGEGGFGGPRPPESSKATAPSRPPDFSVEQPTLETQALLYRLSGDVNPLHADPAVGAMVGFGKPILHGLCTYGIAARAVVRSACGGDGDRLRSLSAQFRKPVWPGETLVTEGWTIEPGRVVLKVSAKERGEVVLGNALAEVSV